MAGSTFMNNVESVFGTETGLTQQQDTQPTEGFSRSLQGCGDEQVEPAHAGDQQEALGKDDRGWARRA